MSDEPAESLIDEPLANDDADPLMTLFVAGIMVLLLGCAVLVLIADRRPPAGL